MQKDKTTFTELGLTNLPGWDGVMGLQFENLVTHNRKILWEMMGLPPEEIVMDGPFFQNASARQAGCQIDYMVQTRFNTLYICEVKFAKNPVAHIPHLLGGRIDFFKLTTEDTKCLVSNRIHI